MDFSIFSKIFKKILNCSSSEIVKELSEAITNTKIKYLEEINDDSIGRYCTGGTKFDKLAKEIKPIMNKDFFIDYLDDNYDDRSQELINEFIKEGHIISSNNWASEIADIFISIINKASGFIEQEVISTKNELSILKETVVDFADPSIEDADKMIKDSVNKTFSAIEKIQSSKLPDELKPYYEVKYSHNDDTYEHIVAKNKEAYEKYPFNTKITFDVSGMTEEERNRMLDINWLSGEANVTNKAVLIGKMLDAKDYFGTIPSPFQKNKKGSMLYILPKPSDELPVRKFTLIMKNDFIQLCFNNIDMHLLKFTENESVVSNSRFDEPYSLTLKLTKKGNYLGFHYTYLVKDKYKDDAKEQLQLYKWHMLGQDKKTKIIVKIEGTDKPLIDSYCNGKYTYNKKDVKNINDTIDYFNKIIFIENQLGYKFKVNNENFYRNMNSIDIVYNYLRKKQKTYNNEMSFDLIVDDSVNEGLVLSGEELGLGKVTMFDEDIEMSNTVVKMKDACISKVEKVGTKYKATILSKKSIIVSK